MGSTVEQLKVWYASMRTMMGRLKKRAKKSGSGGDAITDMSSTEKWVWDKFSFLIPHIETVDARNVASFAAAASASGTEPTPYTNPNSEVASNTRRVATPTLPEALTPASQPGSVDSRRGSGDRINTTGELKDLLIEFISRSTAACSSSYIGKYVEEILSKLPRQIRRDAEANIMQVLHRAERASEHNQTQPPSSQDQQAPIQSQQPQFNQAMWQPQPSQWPPHPIGPQPSIWASQERSYVQRQFPTLQMTSPQTNQPQPGPSFVSLAGPITPDANSFNFSPQLNTPDPLAKDNAQEDPLNDQ